MHIIRYYMFRIGACIIYFVVYITVLDFKSHKNTFQGVRNRPSEHPDQVPRWPSNLVPGIKNKFIDFSRNNKKNEIQRGQLIFRRGAKQKLWLKNVEIPQNMLLHWLESKAQGNHRAI